MKSLEGRTQERSQLVTGREGKLGGSVGNFSNDYNNSVGDLGVYRRGMNGLKAGVLGLFMRRKLFNYELYL